MDFIEGLSLRASVFLELYAQSNRGVFYGDANGKILGYGLGIYKDDLIPGFKNLQMPYMLKERR